MTTGAILRRIAKTPLSVSAHKLATVILNGIAWKEGYNGLERGTAAFTLAHIAEKIGVSRQHLSEFPAELAASSLALLHELLTKQVEGRHKRGGSRFGKTAEVIIGVCTAGAMTEEQHQWGSAPQPERLPAPAATEVFTDFAYNLARSLRTTNVQVPGSRRRCPTQRVTEASRAVSQLALPH